MKFALISALVAVVAVMVSTVMMVSAKTIEDHAACADIRAKQECKECCSSKQFTSSHFSKSRIACICYKKVKSAKIRPDPLSFMTY